MTFAPQESFGSDMMDEINRRVNPLTGKLEPIGGTGYPTLPKPAPGWGHHPGSFQTMEIKPGWKPSPLQTLPWDGTPSPLQPL